ncbi:hypothetical protein [Amycolatopsis sp. NBC_01480]|jgi:hypothetical protein|uniref:hypothetical protein n=1 Tax=Amycolatopsis sp. NBC_01480 TaxID=2903562 RepID=UPI002E2918B5|nr:hypothetical protein [Amycolatopsis sp. NBC_01480]
MNSDPSLEDDLAAALRARAESVPDTPWQPRASMRRDAANPWRERKPRRVGAMLVAAAAVALAVVVVVVSQGPATAPTAASISDTPGHLAPGHFYYSLSVSADGSGERVRSEIWQPEPSTGVWLRRSQVGNGDPATSSGRCLSFNTLAATDACTLAPGWANPSPEFLAHAPRDPAVIAAQLAAAVPGNNDTVSHPSSAYATLAVLRVAARANGLPIDLSRALQRTAALLAPASASRNLDGVPGTAYTASSSDGLGAVVIFDAEGTYIGSPAESFTRGVATEAGAPPVKLFP